MYESHFWFVIHVTSPYHMIANLNITHRQRQPMWGRCEHNGRIPEVRHPDCVTLTCPQTRFVVFLPLSSHYDACYALKQLLETSYLCSYKSLTAIVIVISPCEPLTKDVAFNHHAYQVSLFVRPLCHPHFTVSVSNHLLRLVLGSLVRGHLLQHHLWLWYSALK